MGEKQPLLRTLFHVSGIVIPWTYMVWGKDTALILCGLVFLFLAILDIMRLKGVLAPSFVRHRLKEKEARRPTGALFYAGSCLLTILLFDKSIALASIVVLIVSDPLSSLIGSRWGRRRLFGKSLEGTGVFFFSAVVVIKCFQFGAFAAIGGACAGMLADLLTPRFLDDNLSIPLACAFTLWLLS